MFAIANKNSYHSHMPTFLPSAMPATSAAPSMPMDACGSGQSHKDRRESVGNAGLGAGTFLSSQDLLQGHKTVAIAHNGFVYRLQATRQGKLILTK